MTGPYDDIIHLPHHVSTARPQMPVANRAAQFSPFAALTGYDAAIRETARLTSERIELSESAIADLDYKISVLAQQVGEQPSAGITHFQRDEKKDGGAYITASGRIKKIDDYTRTIVMTDGTVIAIADILDIESDLFSDPT